MINIVSAIFVLLVCSKAPAVTLKITGLKSAALFQTEIVSPLPSDVGSVTVLGFDAEKVPYQGSAAGVSRIYDLEQDVVVVSDVEMKAYGWCFAINGEVPETMADTTAVLNQQTVIEWYYAYAHYKNGDWIGQCVRDR